MTVQTNVTLYLLRRSADFAAARSHDDVMPKQSDEFASSALAC